MSRFLDCPQCGAEGELTWYDNRGRRGCSCDHCRHEWTVSEFDPKRVDRIYETEPIFGEPQA